MLSKKGKELLKKFIEEYGEKEGKRVFYSKENKSSRFAKVVRKHSRGKK